MCRDCRCLCNFEIGRPSLCQEWKRPSGPSGLNALKTLTVVTVHVHVEVYEYVDPYAYEKTRG
jgi:hypothetical protein